MTGTFCLAVVPGMFCPEQEWDSDARIDAHCTYANNNGVPWWFIEQYLTVLRGYGLESNHHAIP